MAERADAIGAGAAAKSTTINVSEFGRRTFTTRSADFLLRHCGGATPTELLLEQINRRALLLDSLRDTAREVVAASVPVPIESVTVSGKHTDPNRPGDQHAQLHHSSLVPLIVTAPSFQARQGESNRSVPVSMPVEHMVWGVVVGKDLRDSAPTSLATALALGDPSLGMRSLGTLSIAIPRMLRIDCLLPSSKEYDTRSAGFACTTFHPGGRPIDMHLRLAHIPDDIGPADETTHYPDGRYPTDWVPHPSSRSTAAMRWSAAVLTPEDAAPYSIGDPADPRFEIMTDAAIPVSSVVGVNREAWEHAFPRAHVAWAAWRALQLLIVVHALPPPVALLVLSFYR